MIAFFDSSALIYLLEGKPPFGDHVRSALAALEQEHPGMEVALSRLTWLECRAGPLKADDAEALQLYDTFFARPDLVWVELDRNVVELATAIRVRHGLRTPDALQAASCLQLRRRHVFLTGDASFRRVHGVDVQIVGKNTP
ncbi:type II toxin-antitoxin system VapC family toxin [Luteimonas dalianensis]|uniref:type II toxin-antitoxin system VapC family toxin n=1 Tax=Luteimonas dalianensis TaxID=1148196 RepID=UPI003BF1B5F1